MPAGGLMQIATSTGEQDLYLTGDPELTFFKSVYKRHTNFSSETINETFYSGESFGRQCRCTLERKGDLISNITLYAKLGSLNSEYNNLIENSRCILHKNTNNKIGSNGEVDYDPCMCTMCLESQYKNILTYGWTNAIGHALIKSTWIEIGGQKIDKQYGEWFEIWTELTMPGAKRDGYYQMIGKVDPLTFTPTTFTGEMELYIPLNFWFCKNIGLALPILTLFYHLVEIIIDFRKFDELWVSNCKGVPSPEIPRFEAQLLIEYVYLDVDERRDFYEESQIYLINQLQCTGDCPILGSYGNINLYFNHPVKELVWVLQRADVIGKPDGVWDDTNFPKGNDWFNYSTFQTQSVETIEDTFDKGYLQLNGVDRHRRMPASYFRLYQTYYHHTRVPDANYIYVYPFGLKPEEHYPTGQQNFSRVDNAKIVLQMKSRRSYTDYTARVYATNFNILVISAGMAGLMFHN
jgi:hypothetical protein